MPNFKTIHDDGYKNVDNESLRAKRLERLGSAEKLRPGKFTQCSENPEYVNDAFKQTYTSGFSESAMSNGLSTMTISKEPSENLDVDSVGDPPCSPCTPEILLSSIKKTHKQELSGILDVSGTVIKNWRHLADSLLQEYDERPKLIQDLELYYCGGGSPGQAFLEKLQIFKPSITKHDFVDLSKKMRRFDIASYLDNDVEDVPCLWKLQKECIEKIGSYLNIDSNDWEVFAEEFRDESGKDLFDKKAMTAIKMSKKIDGINSPTIGLFELLEGKKPDMTIDDLIVECEKLDMNNVKKKLKEIALKIQESKNKMNK